MNRNRAFARALAPLAFIAVASAACGDSASTSSSATTAKATATTAATAASTTTAAAAASTTTAAAATTTAAAVNANLGKCPAGDIATAATKVDYTLESFKITGPTTAKAGKVGFTVKNTNGTHELMILKGTAATQPKDANGGIDETKLAAGAIVFRTAKVSTSEPCTGVADLPAGAYTLVCNVTFNNAGTVIAHAGRGMLGDLVVS